MREVVRGTAFRELDEKTGVAKLPTSSSAGITNEDQEEEEEEGSSFSNWGSHTKLVKPVMVERKNVTEVDNVSGSSRYRSKTTPELRNLDSQSKIDSILLKPRTISAPRFNLVPPSVRPTPKS